MGRISKSSPDLTQAPGLETTLYEIDKFSRRATKNYRTKLSDDLLSELSDLLIPFDLDLADDEVQYLRTVDAPPASAPTPSVSKPSQTKVDTIQLHTTSKGKTKNAFDEMMTKASGGKTQKTQAIALPTKTPKPAPAAAAGSSKQAPIDFDDYDDDFLTNISASDLDIIEKRAKVSTSMPAVPIPPSKHKPSSRPPVPASRFNVNVIPRSMGTKPSGGSSFKSRIMRDARHEIRQQHIERKRTDLGGVVTRLPAASALGSGLGAYQGDRELGLKRF